MATSVPTRSCRFVPRPRERRRTALQWVERIGGMGFTKDYPLEKRYSRRKDRYDL
ncbi:MAG: hypothetical protein ABI193_22220 [Minicystis sp.]